MRLPSIQFVCWLSILIGVWLPWSAQTIQKVEHQSEKESENVSSSFSISMDLGEKAGATVFGFDTYQGWVVLWLPLLALTLGALDRRRPARAGWSQMAVGLVVTALALHLILRPHKIGQASQLVSSGGLLGALQEASVKNAEVTLGPGLFLTLAGGALFCVVSLVALVAQPRRADDELEARGLPDRPQV